MTIAQDLQPFRMGDGKMVHSTKSVCWWWKSRLASSGVFELFCSALILCSFIRPTTTLVAGARPLYEKLHVEGEWYSRPSTPTRLQPRQCRVGTHHTHESSFVPLHFSDRFPHVDSPRDALLSRAHGSREVSFSVLLSHLWVHLRSSVARCWRKKGRG